MLAPLVLAGAIAAWPADFELTARAPLALVEAPGGNTAALAGAIVSVIARRTKLEPVNLRDTARFHACEARGRMSCWARVVRAESKADLVLIAGAQPAAPLGVRASIVLLDVARAIAVLDRPAGTAEEKELEIVTGAVRAASGIVLIDNAVELERAVEAMISGELVELFARTRAWGAFGALELEAAGLAIQIDGRRLGIARQGLTRVGGVDEHAHRLELIDPATGRVELDLAITVEPGGVRRISAPATPHARETNVVVIGAGAAIAAIGVALSAFALAAEPGGVTHRLCAGAGCAASGSTRLLTFDDLEARPTSLGADRSGVPIAAVGLSLIALGGTWAIGAALEESEQPWVSILIGVGAAGASFGLITALD